MDKVAIIGMAPSKDEAPYGDPSWEFWGLNNLYQWLPGVKFNRWFEIHELSINPITHKILRKGLSQWRGLLINEYLGNLQSLNIPIYMQDKCQVVSNAITYPLDNIIDEFGRYFTSTHSWMLALAISMKFKTIGIYGVDKLEDEYKDSRSCFEYLLGMAKGRGIEVVIAKSCPLLKCDKLYGFES
jgi:hypothetical protein